MHLLLAVDSVRLVLLGYALVSFEAASDSDAILEQLAVVKHFRRSGLGGCLVDIAVLLAAQHRKRLATWSVQECARFYRELGFCSEPPPCVGPDACCYLVHPH